MTINSYQTKSLNSETLSYDWLITDVVNAEKTNFETIRLARQALGFTQAQLAKMAATSQPNIARMEKSGYLPSTRLLVKVAKALGLKIALIKL